MGLNKLSVSQKLFNQELKSTEGLILFVIVELVHNLSRFTCLYEERGKKSCWINKPKIIIIIMLSTVSKIKINFC